MYIPKSFVITDENKLFDFINKYNFGIISSIDMEDMSIFSSHIPFILGRKENDEPVLLCHFSKVNKQWNIIENNPKVQIIFNGPHAYVSPKYYVTQNVPTWNYATVHVTGLAHIIRSPEERYETIKKMVLFHENSDQGWRLESLDHEYVEKEMKGFIVVEISNLKLLGKYKLSQNKDIENMSSVISHLLANGGSDAECGLLMKKELEAKLPKNENEIIN